jgi:Fic family protein
MYRDIELAEALSKMDLLKEVDELKSQVDALRPLPKDIEERILQKFRLDWNYHSNAIEGNPYTFGETVAFLMEGITAKGKTLKDHLDIKGHDDAIQYLLSIVKDKSFQLTESEIRSLHKLLLKEPYFSDAVTPSGLPTTKEIQLGKYKSSPNHVKTPTGAIHYYASPEETPIKMGELMQWYNEVSGNGEIHPVVIAALFHHQFTAIHPFDDGNGRMARLLMNLILLQKGYPPVVIKQQDRNNYYQVLRRADAGEYVPITEYIGELLVHSLDIYLKGARGEAIEEVDDIDKEIALLKISLGEDKIKPKVTIDLIADVIYHSIIPLFRKLYQKTIPLDDLFEETTKRMLLNRRVANTVIEIRQDSDFDISNDILTKSNYEGATLYINLGGFKKIKEPVDLDFDIRVKFNEYKYVINYERNGYSEINKFYDERLTDMEINALVKDHVTKLLDKIKLISKGNS